MRLIDADKVIEKITKDLNDIKEESTNDITLRIVKKATELFIKELNETPTAYDIDKVMEELEEIQDNCFQNGIYEAYENARRINANRYI